MVFAGCEGLILSARGKCERARFVVLNLFQEGAFSAERSFSSLGKSERCAKSKTEQTQRLRKQTEVSRKVI
jgi:hypothetical protein